LAISPVLLGRGESLVAGIDLPKLGYKCAEQVANPAALHVVLTKLNVASTFRNTESL
jgi:hypothetical protein